MKYYNPKIILYLCFVIILSCCLALMFEPEQNEQTPEPTQQHFRALDMVAPIPTQKPYNPTPTLSPTPTPNPKIKERRDATIAFMCSKPVTFYRIELKEDLGRHLITAYCDCSKCCTYANQPTASGAYPEYNPDEFTPTTCAIDPSLYKFGDIFYIESEGLFIAQDTGSAVKGKHLDLYFDNHSAVQSYNTHYETVYRAEIVEEKTTIGEILTKEFKKHLLNSKCRYSNIKTLIHSSIRVYS